MVQFFKGSADPRDAAWGQFAEALGGGIGKAVNTYQADKALQEVLNDKSMKNAPISAKMGMLQSKLLKHGEYGEKVLQHQLQTELQAHQEQQMAKQNQIGEIVGKMLNGQPVTDKERAIVPQEVQINVEKAIQGRNKALKTPPLSEREVPPEQIAAIDKAHAIPGYDDMTETQKYNALIHSGVSAPNAERESKLSSQQLTREDQKVQKSFEAQKDFIDETTKAYKGFETEMKPRLLQMQHLKDEDIVSPTAAVFLEALGIPLGALEDPSSELFNKLSQDLLKGLPETYGTRILKVEVENFLKTIPTLQNSPEGRRMIASNMLKLGEMKEVYYNAMRASQKDIEKNGSLYPRDFQQEVFDQVKPQIDRINNEFIKMSEIKHVPPRTTPFFAPNGSVKFVDNAKVESATKAGGRRIW